MVARAADCCTADHRRDPRSGRFLAAGSVHLPVVLGFHAQRPVRLRCPAELHEDRAADGGLVPHTRRALSAGSHRAALRRADEQAFF